MNVLSTVLEQETHSVELKLRLCVNHMTAPDTSWRDLLSLASAVGASGVEFRNDLPTPLFSGDCPETVAREMQESGLVLYGLSQVYPFNSYSDAIAQEVESLINIAKRCGAQTISLIPRNDGTCQGNGERQANLRLALREIKPMLANSGLVGLVEPLGFLRSSLRTKEEALNAIEGVNGSDYFKIVHDTFHHHLAQETEFYPEYTRMVHISGVVEPTLAIDQMEDEHRKLVDEQDRLGNIDQINTLIEMGYTGPISMECFSTEIHKLPNLANELGRSLNFVRAACSQEQVQ